MILEEYEMVCYCERCRTAPCRYTNSATFRGKNRTLARKAAIAAGWRFVHGEPVCPAHPVKSKKEPPSA